MEKFDWSLCCYNALCTECAGWALRTALLPCRQAVSEKILGCGGGSSGASGVFRPALYVLFFLLAFAQEGVCVGASGLLLSRAIGGRCLHACLLCSVPSCYRLEVKGKERKERAVEECVLSFLSSYFSRECENAWEPTGDEGKPSGGLQWVCW